MKFKVRNSNPGNNLSEAVSSFTSIFSGSNERSPRLGDVLMRPVSHNWLKLYSLIRPDRLFPKKSYHFGIYEDEETVYHFSETGDSSQIISTSLDEFVNGQETWIIELNDKTALPEYEVISRARSKLGFDKYHPSKCNCEHFANYCKYGEYFSDQIDTFNEIAGNLYSDSNDNFLDLGQYDICALDKAFYAIQTYGEFYTTDPSTNTIRVFSKGDYQRLKSGSHIVVYEKAPRNLDGKQYSRLSAAKGTHCIPANSYDFCYWVIHGKKYGFLTSGGFLEINV